jgi:hypothetical protein
MPGGKKSTREIRWAKKRRLWAPFSSSLPYYFILAAISSSFFAEPGCYFEGANRLFPEAGD